MKLKRDIHQAIWQVLTKFDAQYFREHGILFGGGTRISMELSEYRESVDIDFLCASPESYKAVRSQVSQNSLGCLIAQNESLIFKREIRSDRDAVRTFVECNSMPIKLEFIHFDHYPLKANDDTQIFPVPCIDIPSCYLTKLLANADRNSGNEKKDIFDLIMMHEHWGAIPQSAWQAADDQYGLKVVMNGLRSALNDLSQSPERYIELAVTGYSIEPVLAQKIVTKFSKTVLNSILEK